MNIDYWGIIFGGGGWLMFVDYQNVPVYLSSNINFDNEDWNIKTFKNFYA